MAEKDDGHRGRVVVASAAVLVIGGVVALVWAVLALGAHHGADTASDTTIVGSTPSRAISSSVAARRPGGAGGSGGLSPKPTSAAAPGPTRGPLIVVALGDSVPAATTCDCHGYPDLLGQSLRRSTGRSVAVHNDATDGWTTSDVENDLNSAQTSADLSHANLVIVEVGANDFDLGRVGDPGCLPAATSECWAATLTALRTGLTTVVAGIRRADTRPDVQVVLLGYWNVTVDGDVGHAQGQDFVTGSDALTRAVNETIATVAGAARATYVDAYSPFKNDPSLRLTTALLGDGDHLSARGHAIMAAGILSALTTDGVVADLTTAP